MNQYRLKVITQIEFDLDCVLETEMLEGADSHTLQCFGADVLRRLPANWLPGKETRVVSQDLSVAVVPAKEQGVPQGRVVLDASGLAVIPLVFPEFKLAPEEVSLFRDLLRVQKATPDGPATIYTRGIEEGGEHWRVGLFDSESGPWLRALLWVPTAQTWAWSKPTKTLEQGVVTVAVPGIGTKYLRIAW